MERGGREGQRRGRLEADGVRKEGIEYGVAGRGPAGTCIFQLAGFHRHIRLKGNAVMHRTMTIACIAWALCASCAYASAQEGEMLIENPSFEEGTLGETPPRWTKDTLSKKDERRSPDSKSTFVAARGGHSGEHKAVMRLDEGDKWMYMEQRWKTPEITKGRQFVLSAWLRGETQAPVVLQVTAYCHSVKKAYSARLSLSLTDLWQRHEVRVTAGAEPTGATRVEDIPAGKGDYVRAVIQMQTPGVDVEIDDVALTRLAPGDAGYVEEPRALLRAPATEVDPAGPRKWLEPTDEYVTPHIKWMKPAAAGPLKVLFITYRVGMREIVEICQRFDIKREVFAIERPEVFAGETGTGEYDFGPFPGTRPEDQVTRLREKLKGEYDVIVIGNIPWEVLPDWARGEILGKVEDGTGLVGYINGARGADLDAAMTEKATATPREIAGLFPYAGLPAFEEYTSFPDFIAGTIDAAQHGKGRIALLGGYDCTTYQMLVPAITGSFTDWHMVHYDYYLAFMGRVMDWASKRASEVRFADDMPESLRVDRTQFRDVSFDLESDAVQTVQLAFALRHGKTGEVITETERTASLGQGRTNVSFKAPGVPAGPYFADLWVKQDGKTLVFGSVLLHVTSESQISDVALTGSGFERGDAIKNYAQSEAITGRVTVSGARKGQVVIVSQRDNYGRLVAREKYPLAKDGEETVAFELRPPAPLSVLQDVEVRLIDGDSVLDVGRDTFTYNDLFAWDNDVHYIIWEGYSGDAYVNPALHKVIRDAGITLFWLSPPWGTPGSHQKRVVDGSVLRANMAELGQLFGPRGNAETAIRMRPLGEPQPAPGGGYIRVPCVSDPDYLRRSVEIRAEAIEDCAKFSTRHFTLGSELSLTHGQLEVCFGPESIRAFREYLQREYGTIDRLNEEYGSQYADWSEITPVPYEKAIETGQIPLWIDFRRSMDHAWANQFALIKKRAEKIVPGVKIGYDASNDPGHSPKIGGLGGDDYWALTQNMTLVGPYFWPLQMDCIRDFASPGTLIGGGWFGGYSGLFRGDRIGALHRWIVWYTFLRGANSFWLWQGSGGSAGHLIGTTIAPDFTWYDFMSDSRGEINRIQAGIGKLAMAMDRPDDGVAILYSQSSMLMADFTAEFPKRWDSLAALTVILPESNFQYRMIASEQLEDGVLSEGDIRLLYLPYCQALSPKEAEEIRAFVEAGGAVAADLRPAVTDEHGKPYPSGALDDVFGVRQDTKKAAPVQGSVVLPERVGEAEGFLPMTYADSSIALAGGKALGRVKETPAVITNDFGKGKAVLLNFAISDYVVDKLMSGSTRLIRFADEEAAAKTADLVRAIFEQCGLRPALAIRGQAPGCHVYRFESGDAQMIGLLQESAPFLPGVGAKPMPQLEAIARRRSEVCVILKEPKHVYDIFSREYLGCIAQIPRTVSPGVPHLFAALPYKVESTAMQLEKTALRQGEALSFTASVETDGAAPGLHVFRIELVDPDGKRAEMYTRNARADDGRHTGCVQLSLDAKIGDWTITARDVATGAGGEATFRVLAAEPGI
ncbi:MAG: beta-galactosidase trimerization domain-containing protein [Planctomycetota bacterium]